MKGCEQKGQLSELCFCSGAEGVQMCQDELETGQVSGRMAVGGS